MFELSSGVGVGVGTGVAIGVEAGLEEPELEFAFEEPLVLPEEPDELLELAHGSE